MRPGTFSRTRNRAAVKTQHAAMRSYLPLTAVVPTVGCMEGFKPAWAAEYERTHPEVTIWQTWRAIWAWNHQPGADEFTGALTHGATKAELLRKLGG